MLPVRMMLLLSFALGAQLHVGSRRVTSSPSYPCIPAERLVPFHVAPESAIVRGKAILRTESALKTVYPTPHNMMGLYPGERISVFAGDRHIGFAVFDGCELIPEWSDPTAMRGVPITQFEVYAGKNVPAPLRNKQGYRVMKVLK